MGVPGLVVADDATLECLLDVGGLDGRRVASGGEGGGHLQGVEGETGVAAGALGQRPGRPGLERQARLAQAPLPVGHRPPQNRLQGVG